MIAGDKSPPFPKTRNGGLSHQSLCQACWISFHVTARALWGGIRLPLAIGAVVDGASIERHTPNSGQDSPVRAVVPIGLCVVL